jgi:hypothetical protein
MKNFLFAWILLAVSTGIKSQTTNAENTFAVVGIANYEYEGINLNYANRDAQIFAGYLMSKSGGALPEDNIRLLTDTNATTAAVYNALKWFFGGHKNGGKASVTIQLWVEVKDR